MNVKKQMRLERVTVWLLLLIAALTVAVGYFYTRSGGILGAEDPPFVAEWDPLVDPLVVVAVVVLPLLLLASQALVRSSLRPLAVASLLFFVALGLGVSLGMSRLGTFGLWEIFDLRDEGSFEAANEYLPSVPMLQWGPHFYLDRFAEMVPSQPVNIAGHGPAPLLLMRALSIDGPRELAALCIGAAAATAPLTYVIARQLSLSETRARIAGVLVACSPVVLLFGYTSFDSVYMAIGAAATALLLSRSRWLIGAGLLVFGVSTTFSWALLGVGAAVALVVLIRDGVRQAVWIAAGCGVAFIGVNAVLAIGWGYDPIGTLVATEGVYRNSLARVRPYWFWLFGSPVAFGLFLGPAIVAGAVRGALRRSPAGVAIVAVVLVATVAGFTKAETERIWLIFAPLFCVGAAEILTTKRLKWTLTGLLVPAFVIQLLFWTIW